MTRRPYGRFFFLSALALMFAGTVQAQVQVVINEIMQNPSAVPDSFGEWFELHNPGGSTVDINGWTIMDNDFDSHVINNGGPLVIPPGGYLVLGNNSDSGANGGVTVDYDYGGSLFLGNGSDELVLVDLFMTEIDRVEWDNGATFPDPNGASMSLIDPALDNNVGSNWCQASTTFGAGDFGTPGGANDCIPPVPQIVINEILQNPSAVADSSGEWFELYNAGGSPVDINGWTIADNDFDSHVINNGGPLMIPAGGYLVLANNADSGANGGVSVDYAYSGVFLGNGSDELVLVDLFMAEIDRVEWDNGATFPDPNGASMSLIDPALDNNVGSNWCQASTPFGAGDFGTPGSANDCAAGLPAIVINEILQNPAAVSDGNGEWFELYNAGDMPVDIDGWTIQDNDFDSHVINNGGPLSIAAGGYLVLGNNADSGTNGGVSVDYAYSGVFLANGADELVLIDGAMAEIDRVEWDGGPNFPDPNGASMSLIDPALDNNVGANWCEASTPFGAGDNGTPGAINDCPGGPVQILINEVDADQSGTDSAEFVEIFDGGAGSTSLDGLVLVFYNGSNDQAYEAFDLDGLSTGADGYFVLCGDSANTPNCDLDVTPDTNLIQNGADAVALYMDDASSFPDGTPVTTTNLLDALVYDTNDADDPGLLVLLNAGQPQVNEGGGADSTTDSNQRCPNGSGGPRNTDSYQQWPPSPGAENSCVAGPPICGDTGSATLISAVQGTTDTSPLAGMQVEIEGVVVGDLQGANEYGGLFVQEEDADNDGDPLTSEGIFVFTTEPAAVGDQVRVRGTVVEFFGLTEISPATDVVICASGATPPTPVMPTLPLSAADEFEAIESMSVVLPQALVINEVQDVFRFGEVTLSSIRRTTPTAAVAPGAPANAMAAANALDALILDDRRTGSNLLPPINGQDDTTPLAADNPVRNGQIVTGLSGVMHYAFNNWRVQPTAPFLIDESGNPRSAGPDAVGGTLRVAGFNVLNFFTTIDTGAPICGPSMNEGCRGADSMDEYTRQLDKLVAAIAAIDADVLGLVELENNASDSLQALVDGVNASVGAGTYDFVDTGTIGGDVIKVGFIYKPAAVTPEGAFALLTSAVDPRFDDSLNRPSLAQTFRATNNLAPLTVIVNHLKSKGCGGATGPDEDQGDGQGCYNATRTNAAEALRDWANGDPTGTGTDNLLIVGDLNSYEMEDPIQAILAGGFTSLEPLFGGPDAYSFVFSGQKGSLDYALSSAAVTPKVTGAAPWNTNADETPALDYNTENGVLPSFYAPTAYRSSDHDPIIVGLDLNPPTMLTIPTTAAGVDATIEISGDIGKCGFSAAGFIDPASVTPPPPANLEFPYGVLQFTAERCTPGATATIDVTLPPIPDLLSLIKFTTATGWTPWQFQLIGNTFRFQVTDGGSGDEDGLVNGVLADPVGPAVVAAGQERATFRVTKDFDDDNPAEVEVSLSCNTGLPLEQTTSLAEGEFVEFVIGDFIVGELDCSVSEAVPQGYAPSHAASFGAFGFAASVNSTATACTYLGIENGQFLCQITNTLQEVNVTVIKQWIDENPEFNLPEFVFIELRCSGAGFVGAQYISPAEPGVFSVFPHFDGETCTVTEEQQAGVLTDTTDCDGLSIAPGVDAECTVVNTRLYAGIPTLSQYGLVVLSLLMLLIGVTAARRFA